MLCIPENNKQTEIPFQNSVFPRKKLKTRAIIRNTASRMEKEYIYTAKFISIYTITKRIISRIIKRNEKSQFKNT